MQRHQAGAYMVGPTDQLLNRQKTRPVHWNSEEGGDHEQEGGRGSAVQDERKPSRQCTTITDSLTLLAPVNEAGFRASTQLYGLKSPWLAPCPAVNSVGLTAHERRRRRRRSAHLHAKYLSSQRDLENKLRGIPGSMRPRKRRVWQVKRVPTLQNLWGITCSSRNRLNS